MYIIKNAYLNIVRGKGRNILIGIIISVITIGSCIALSINKSGNALIETYKDNNPLAVSFELDPNNLKDRTAKVTTLTADDIKKYAESDYVSDYYYVNEVSLSSDIEAVNYDDMFNENNGENKTFENDKAPNKMNIGDFRLTGYSDPSYISEFIDGTKKIIDGKMYTRDTDSNVIIISSELATTNDLKVGDEITFYLPDDTDTTFDFEIIGIYEDTSNVETDNFMNLNANNSRNQIYTTINSISAINDENTNMKNKGITATIYLKNNDDLDKYEQEVRKKGLSDDYTVKTNEDEILKTLEPISNISNFSLTFLIIILIIGGVILGLINLINIRERKYEIGVLRAIGMSKKKVTLLLTCEIFIVSIISLVIGIIVGSLLSQPVSNKMLENEITSYSEEYQNLENNFGSQGFDRPAFNKSSTPKINPDNYVNKLDIKIDPLTILKLLIIELFLTIISGIVAISVINKYEPNKILQNR